MLMLLAACAPVTRNNRSPEGTGERPSLRIARGEVVGLLFGFARMGRLQHRASGENHRAAADDIAEQEADRNDVPPL